MLNKILEIIAEEKKPLLLVVNETVKQRILSTINGALVNITFMSLSDLLDKLTFTFSEEAIYYVMKQYHVNYEIALTFLNNLKYLDFINSDDDPEKVMLLQSIYDYLFTHKLILEDKLFINYCQKRQVIIYGYLHLKKEELIILNRIQYQYIPIEYQISKQNEVFECKTFENELFYALESICKLITQGVPLNDIKLVGVSDKDFFLTKEMFKMYQIPLNLHEKKSLYSYDLTKDLFKQFINNELNIQEYQVKINNEQENIIFNAVINVFNKFARIKSDNLLFECLKQTLIHTYISDNLYSDAIEVISINQILSFENKYIYVLGFNQGKIPLTYKDEDFFSDDVKQKNNITTASELNQNANEMVMAILASNNQIYLSYHTDDDNPSPLIEELKLKKKVLSSTYYSLYSPAINKVLLVRYLDVFLKYGTKSEALLSLLKTYQIPYLQYDNSFKGINQQQYLDSLNHKLLLSYTTIDTYYKCSFMYYLKKVLKIDPFIENFITFIGNLYHRILSRAFNDDFDFESEYNDYLSTCTYKLNNKEKFLLNKLKIELTKIIDILKEQLQYINYQNALYEENFNIKVINSLYPDFDITFTGFIDKIWYQTITDEDGNDVTYISIVDYKTGKLDIKLDLVPYGLSLQLPVYLYLASHSNLPNVKVYGFFLQNILQNELKADSEEEYIALKKKALQLSGYIVENVPSKAEFDRSKSDSQIIKSLRLKNDGTYYANAKVLTNEYIERLVGLVEEKINYASTNILNANFTINPKVSKGVNISCQYCTFHDICYKSYKDYIHLEVGDENDQMD